MNLFLKTSKKESCTGCGACENICPVTAISMYTDQEGFWYPVLNEDACLQCGKCADVCPISEKAGTDAKPDNEIKIYAAWSLNPEIRYQSTSGGLFSELAASVLERRGIICGAVYDEKHMVRHMLTTKMQDIKRLRQSKYVQSDMTDSYQQIGSHLRQNNVLLFCGTPCQCEGIIRYCKAENIDTRNLYLIDFICRGSNSPKVYKKFLEELESIHQAKIKKVWFKNKTYGWNRFSTRIDFDDGSSYLQDRYHDTYIRGYIEENLFIRPSCTACKFKGLHRCSDITLADFWGVKLAERMEESDGGTSMVMLHTEKGKKLWNFISSRLYWTEKNLDDVVNGNECFYNSIKQGEYREQFMADLDQMPVIENIERFLKNNSQGRM